MTNSKTKSYNLRHNRDPFPSSIESVELVRPEWTDSRLDGLNVRVTEVRDDVRDLRKEMRSEFGALRKEMRTESGALRKEMRADFSELRGEFAELQRTLIHIGGGIIGTLVVGILGVIATQL
jgi:hypothetical protein